MWLVRAAFAAANVCVRAPGDVTNDGDGTTWAAAASGGATGARKGMPASLTRGSTYYVADGTGYGDYNFDDTESGTTVITVKKATVADHGTATGWSDTMGDGQAVFAQWQWSRDYYVLDGQVGAGFGSAAYGFRVTMILDWPINFPPGGDHITCKYVDVGGPESNTYSAGNPDKGIYIVGNGTTLSDFMFDHVYGHNNNFTCMQLVTVDTFVVQNSWFQNNWNKEVIRGFDKCKNGIIRWNTIKNGCQDNPDDSGANGCTAEIAIWDGGAGDFDNNSVYDNVFYDKGLAIDHSDAVILIGGDGATWVGSPTTGSKVYNNTIAGIQNGAVNIQVNGTGNEVYNNLFYDVNGTPSIVPNTGNNGEVGTNPFVNYSGENFHLASAQTPATSLSSPYDAGLDGVLMSVDGTPDRGAFQFDAGGGDTTPPTVNSATINNLGTTITFACNETVSIGAGGNGGFTLSMSGGAVTATYASGSGSSSLVYNLSRTVLQVETGTDSYTQPGNGVEDTAGNDLATYSGGTVTNGSTQTGGGSSGSVKAKRQTSRRR
jgi:hypothetical protein